MFSIRSVQEKDIDDLYILSSLGNFINLPNDKKKIQEQVLQSVQSFSKPAEDLSQNYYIFVLIDHLKNQVIGTSLIHAQHGTEKSPHFFLKVGTEKKFSSTINKSFEHGTLKLGFSIDGPTEIGGLVLDPSYQGHKLKLGKQISFARFLFMAMYPERFKDQVHSELLPPFDKNGNSSLWEAIGRPFFEMDYHEADQLSRTNKEFILNLFPSENIYQKLLPKNAQSVIGAINAGTLPVKSMLEKVGFTYTHEIDPFDGGPHYRCRLSEIKPVKSYGRLKIRKNKDKTKNRPYLVCQEKDFFECTLVEGVIDSKEICEKYHSIPLFY